MPVKGGTHAIIGRCAPMSSWFSPKVEKRRSGIEGRGLFASEKIAAGEIGQLHRGGAGSDAVFQRHGRGLMTII